MINPIELQMEMAQDYLELLSQFKSKVSKFKYLNENEFFNSENMCIQCLSKDEDYESKYTFWWNHYQKSEQHILTLFEFDGITKIEITSNTYDFLDKSFGELRLVEPTKLYAEYISLYYANSWFQQLISE